MKHICGGESQKKGATSNCGLPARWKARTSGKVTFYVCGLAHRADIDEVLKGLIWEPVIDEASSDALE